MGTPSSILGCPESLFSVTSGFTMKAALALLLVGCMVATAMAQYVPEVPPYGDINNDGIPNAYDLNYDGKVDAGLYAHHLYPYGYAYHGYLHGLHPLVHPHLHGLHAAVHAAPAEAAPAEE